MLPADEQIQYLFDVYDAEQKKHSGIDLGTFFESVRHTIIEINDTSEFESSDEYDIDGVSERVDVLIDDTNIMVESNSLKALRHVIYKFVESGYILKRDIPLEKTFRKDKMTKYLRIFRIIDRSIDLCYN
jgi:hypothetical protein